MNEKPIRAVKMVREIRDRMYEETKHMSAAEYMAYITERAVKVEAEIARSGEADRVRSDHAG